MIMQHVELVNTADLTLCCPFCGTRMFADEGLNRCAHTLFQATDEGFEYVCEELRDICEGYGDGGGSMDEFLSGIEVYNGILFMLYAPAPFFMGSYFAFAPAPEVE